MNYRVIKTFEALVDGRTIVFHPGDIISSQEVLSKSDYKDCFEPIIRISSTNTSNNLNQADLLYESAPKPKGRGAKKHGNP